MSSGYLAPRTDFRQVHVLPEQQLCRMSRNSDWHGNILEWCHDWLGPDDTAGHIDPVQAKPENGTRLLHGGSWSSAARDCRGADRHDYAPVFRDSRVRFRIAEVPGVQSANASKPITADSSRQTTGRLLTCETTSRRRCFCADAPSTSTAFICLSAVIRATCGVERRGSGIRRSDCSCRTRTLRRCRESVSRTPAGSQSRALRRTALSCS